MENIRILDLFSGTGSVKKAAALDSAFECLSLDISDRFSRPDILADIHDWNYKEFDKDRFDIIAASVPCQMYSCARTKAATPRDIPAANRNVQHVLDIIDYFKPAVFWIENPVCVYIVSPICHLQQCINDDDDADNGSSQVTRHSAAS
jgi:site-specific DNA-cytosine methylase